jgi:AcrR family transcriptional regulator
VERGVHPTKATLLDTAVTLLDTLHVDQITAEMVLDRSGVSRGSLYHHFEDLPDLLETALVARFARAIDESVARLRTAYAKAGSVDDLRRFLGEVTRGTQARRLAARRKQRVIAFAEALDSERMLARLGLEQRRLTGAMTDVIAAAQERGWMRRELDPHAVAVLIQSYTLGRIIDDVDPEGVDEAAWIALIDHVVGSLLTDADD